MAHIIILSRAKDVAQKGVVDALGIHHDWTEFAEANGIATPPACVTALDDCLEAAANDIDNAIASVKSFMETYEP